jgi:hypothetical protein
MKVGDSITYSDAYLHCFAEPAVDLGDVADLQPTLDHFLAGDADGATPFDRWSHAVLGGKTASWALDGDPSPLAQEIEAIAPGLAVVMFGTNDASYWEDDTARMLRWYGEEMLALTDALVEAEVIPMLMTIPPRDSSTFGPRTGVVNGVVRGIAQGFQVPLIDYHRLMIEAPDWGLSSDGVHPNASGDGCDFTASGLDHGYNLRNLVTLEALDRTRRALQGDPDVVDEVQPRADGDGSPDDPARIERLPFTRMSDTAASPHRRYDSYPGCDDGQDESGPDEHFALRLDRDTALRLVVIDRPGVDVDLHLLAGDGDCLARDDTLIEGTLAAGDYRVVLDTYVADGVEQSGAYVVVAVACDAGDPACADPID